MIPSIVLHYNTRYQLGAYPVEIGGETLWGTADRKLAFGSIATEFREAGLRLVRFDMVSGNVGPMYQKFDDGPLVVRFRWQQKKWNLISGEVVAYRVPREWLTPSGGWKNTQYAYLVRETQDFVDDE